MVTRRKHKAFEDGFYSRSKLLEMRAAYTIGSLAQHINLQKPSHLGLNVDDGEVSIVLYEPETKARKRYTVSDPKKPVADISAVRPKYKPSSDFLSIKVKLTAQSGEFRAYLVEAGFSLDDVINLGRVDLILLVKWARSSVVEFASVNDLGDADPDDDVDGESEHEQQENEDVSE